MVYELPLNMSGLIDLFQYSNRVTNDVFIIMLLITVYLVPLIYLLLRDYKWDEASMTAGFIVTITAVLLRVTEITTVDRYLFFAIATIVIPLAFIFLRDTST